MSAELATVNPETGELLDPSAAERRAMKIGLRLDAIAENYQAVMPMIREAIDLRDDIALGYRSPGDYVSDRFGQALSKLGMELRREVVRELTDAGMSTRAIAPVVGVHHSTVADDVAATVGGPTVTVGINGKTYVRPPRDAAPLTERNFQEAELVNAFRSMVRPLLAPKNIASLSPKARALLIDLLQNAIDTLEGTDQ